MIKIICGPKGTGKTKEIINFANRQDIKGIALFITEGKRYMYDLNREIKYIDTQDYDIAGVDALVGFVKGVAAANSDTEYLFLDGIARICKKELSELEDTFNALAKMAATDGITLVITCSCSEEELPAFVAKYL